MSITGETVESLSGGKDFTLGSREGKGEGSVNSIMERGLVWNKRKQRLDGEKSWRQT